MKRFEKLWFAGSCLVALVIAGLLFFWSPGNKPQAPDAQTLVAQSQEQGGCSQCLANNCYSAPCNMECILVGNGCETRVMGGAQAPYTPATREAGGDYAVFFMQRVIRGNSAMEAAGVIFGDTVVRVNGVYAGSDQEFAKLVLSLPKGTVLTVWKSTGELLDITL